MTDHYVIAFRWPDDVDLKRILEAEMKDAHRLGKVSLADVKEPVEYLDNIGYVRVHLEDYESTKFYSKMCRACSVTSLAVSGPSITPTSEAIDPPVPPENNGIRNRAFRIPKEEYRLRKNKTTKSMFFPRSYMLTLELKPYKTNYLTPDLAWKVQYNFKILGQRFQGGVYAATREGLIEEVEKHILNLLQQFFEDTEFEDVSNGMAYLEGKKLIADFYISH